MARKKLGDGAKAPPVRTRSQSAAAAAAVLVADFEGTCALEIHDSPSPPPKGEYPLRCRIEFSADRKTIALRDFEPVHTGDYRAKVGPLSVTNSTAVHLKSSSRGILSPDGHVDIDVVLYFDHAFDAPFVEEDSHLEITLRTRDGGVPLDARGGVTLAGTGRFSGGALDACRCRLVYRGRVNPLPW